MKKLFCLALFFCAAAFAQVNATQILGVNIAPLPSFSANPMPNGDTADNYFLGMDPATSTLKLKDVHLAIGPSSLSSNIGLTGNSQNMLWTSPGSYGMRGGLVAYVPVGVWELWGTLVVAGPANTEYDITVMQGTQLSTDPTRSGVVSESPIVVGGGVGTTSASDYMPVAIPFSAHLIQFAGDSTQANEISIRVFPKNANGGAALGLVGANQYGGGVPANYISSFTIMRVRGF